MVYLVLNLNPACRWILLPGTSFEIIDGLIVSYLLRRLTIPLLMPGIIAGAMLAFTLSLDGFVISFFTASPQSVTLPLFIYAAVRRGVTPQIHALSTLVFWATIVRIIGMERFTRRQ